MLDLAQRTGSDAVIGLVEDVVTYSPEWEFFPAVARPGTSYKLTRRVELPGAQFRDANEGVPVKKSRYVQETKEMFFLDSQMEVDEKIVQADPRQIGDVLADEASGAMQGAVHHVGAQVWYGTNADAKGFVGLANQLSDDTVYAGGTTDTTSAFLVDIGRHGVRFDVGNDGRMQMGEWLKQKVKDDAGNSLMAFVNNFSSHIGLNIASAYCCYRIRGIDATNKLTDALVAKLISTIPQARVRSGNWRLFMNPVARYTLQLSRQAVGQIEGGSGGTPAMPPTPTEAQGIPIVCTDNLLNTELTTAS